MSLTKIGDSMTNFRPIENNNQKNYDDVKCGVCGNNVRFYDDQYRVNCPKCGTSINFKKAREVQCKKEYSCWVCMDTGIVEYPIQVDGTIYSFAARCACPKGMKYPATIPLLNQCKAAPRAEFIELRNMRAFGLVYSEK